MRSLILVTVLLSACSLIGPVVEEPWQELSPMEVARSEHPAVVYRGDLVVVGGFVNRRIGSAGVTATVEAYDPSADRWRRLADLPEPRHHVMAAEMSDRLFVVGGFDESGFQPVDSVWELVDGSWVERSRLPSPVGAAAAVSLDDAVYVVGGVRCGDCVFRYDPARDTWSQLGPLLTPREHVAAVSFQNRIWVIGGRWQATMHASVEIYDPATGTSEPGPSLTEARSGFGAAVVGEQMWVAGGEVFGPTRVVDTVEVLDTDHWTTVDVLPLGLHGVPLATLDGSLYVPGGSTSAGAVDNPGRLFVRDAR